MPFEDSRRLTGSNLFFASTGAVLELARVTADDALLARWQERVERARAQLGWASRASQGSDWCAGVAAGTVARLHRTGASLAITAPCDQLLTATELNEWALCSALLERDPLHWSSLQDALVATAVEAAQGGAVDDPPVLEEARALERLRRLAVREARPQLRALLDAAEAGGMPHLLDDSLLTLGAGAGGRSYPIEGLPAVEDVPWRELRAVPAVVVTGSNGKTSTVRLVAACARSNGWRDGYSCTDGVNVGGAAIASGDYSGPAGARLVMRDPRVEAAVLETARGGILRRGIAVNRANAAVVTNVSPDHFGEYGIHDLDGLADVKLTVASILAPQGLLVLNADDALLRLKAGGLAQRFGRCPRLAWFALDADAPVLRQHRKGDGWTCGVRDGNLQLSLGGAEHDLGPVATMPLTVGGSAGYNVANLAAAALAAAAIGIAPEAIASVFAGFGSDPADNPGRLMRFDYRGVTVLVDYAHNPAGLAGLLRVAQQLRGNGGRLGILLGHAGNRQDADLEDIARVASGFQPDLIVVKEDEAHLRGRNPGEIPRIIRTALVAQGMPESSLALATNELAAVLSALAWARPGDVLALPVHSPAARAATLALLGGAARGP